MKEPLNHMEFDNELNDGVFDASGDLLVPSGRPLADGLAELLRSGGINVSGVQQRDYYGRDFRWRDGWSLITAVLQHDGPNGRRLIVVRDPSLLEFQGKSDAHPWYGAFSNASGKVQVRRP